MINYRVDDLDALLEALRAEGVETDPEVRNPVPGERDSGEQDSGMVNTDSAMKLVYNVLRIEMHGDSLRKNRQKANTYKTGTPAFNLYPVAAQAPSSAQQRRQGGEDRLRQTRGIFHGDQDGS